MAEITVKSAEGGKERFPLVQDRVTIGRSRESDIFLPDQWLSRHHAEIRRDGAAFVVVDLGSKNGTLLNGDQVASTQRLRDGDVITLGEHILTFSDEAAAEEEAAPEGTRIFSAKELSDIRTRPSHRPRGAGPAEPRAERAAAGHAASWSSTGPLDELFETVLDLLFEAVPAERARHPAPGRRAAGSRSIKASRARQGQTPPTRVSRSIARKVLERRRSRC